MKKKIIRQDNYILYYADHTAPYPTSVYSVQNTIFNYNATTGFEIKEPLDGALIKITNAELNAGDVLNAALNGYTIATFFDWLTLNTGGFSLDNVKVIS